MEVHPRAVAALGLDGVEVAAFEIDLARLESARAAAVPRRFQGIPSFPVCRSTWRCSRPRRARSRSWRRSSAPPIPNYAGASSSSISMRGRSSAEARRSAAFHVELRSDERTLAEGDEAAFLKSLAARCARSGSRCADGTDDRAGVAEGSLRIGPLRVATLVRRPRRGDVVVLGAPSRNRRSATFGDKVPDPLKIHFTNPPSPKEYRVSRGLMGGFGMAVNPNLLYPPIELAHVASVLERDGCQVSMFDSDAEGRPRRRARRGEGFGGRCLRVRLLVDHIRPRSRARNPSARGHGEAGRIVGVAGHQHSRGGLHPLESGFRRPRRAGARGARLGARACVEVRRLESQRYYRERQRRRPLRRGRRNLLPPRRRHRPHGRPREDRRARRAPLPRAPPAAQRSIPHPRDGWAGHDREEQPRLRPRLCFLWVHARPGFALPDAVGRERGRRASRRSATNLAFETWSSAIPSSRCARIGSRRSATRSSPRISTFVGNARRPSCGSTARCWRRWRRRAASTSRSASRARTPRSKKYCGNKLRNHDAATKVFDACRELGIETRAFCMIGFPGETDAQVEETIQPRAAARPRSSAVLHRHPVSRDSALPRDLWQRADRVLQAERPLRESHQSGDVAAGSGIEDQGGVPPLHLRPHRLAREMRHPMRLANKVARYLTLFRARAPQA